MHEFSLRSQQAVKFMRQHASDMLSRVVVQLMTAVVAAYTDLAAGQLEC